MPSSSKLERQTVMAQMYRKLDRWFKMTDVELLSECRIIWPNIAAASRDECLKYLILNYVSRLLTKSEVFKEDI